MKVLVTGGAGLIGSHVVDELLKRGYEVRILDNLEKPTHLFGKPDWIPHEAEFIEGDMRSENDVERALEGVDYVCHQAAFGGFVPEISKYVKVNALGTAFLLEKIIGGKSDVRKVVMASSQAVYGEGKYRCSEHGVQDVSIRGLEQLVAGEWEVKCPLCESNLDPVATDERASIDCITPYAISKYAQERLLLGWGKTYDIPVTALRYSVTYGPRQSIYNPYTGVVSIFSTRILNELAPVVYEDGQQNRDFVYVGDIASANVHCLENSTTNGQVYNVGSGRPTTVLELVQALAQVYERKVEPLLRGEFRPGEVRHLFSDASRLMSTGWKPRTKLRDGIQAYVEWISTQGNIREYFSEGELRMRQMGGVRNARSQKEGM